MIFTKKITSERTQKVYSYDLAKLRKFFFYWITQMESKKISPFVTSSWIMKERTGDRYLFNLIGKYYNTVTDYMIKKFNKGEIT